MIEINLLTANEELKYKMLGRLQRDCEYYLNFGNKNKKHLWAGNVKNQIAMMKLLYNSFDKSKMPMWLTYRQIKEYEARMGQE